MAPVEEVVLKTLDSVYAWPKPKAGMSLTGAKVGQLMLTDQRLLFLSTGTSGLAKALTAQLLLGTVGSLVFGRTKTSELDLSALENEGSFAVPLGNVEDIATKKRWDFAMYLTLRFRDDNGETQHRALMTKTGFQYAKFREWASDVLEARANRKC